MSNTYFPFHECFVTRNVYKSRLPGKPVPVDCGEMPAASCAILHAQVDCFEIYNVDTLLSRIFAS